jgi:cell wall-associated NlpC family hydrolase
MGIRRAHCSATALTALIIVAITAGCSVSPRFTGRGESSEPSYQPDVVRTPDGGGAPSDAEGNDVVKRAQDYLGTPYRNGGTTSNGLDCSGLTFTVYRSLGVNLPRVSRDQARAGNPVARNELNPGDLVFFGSGNSVSHVGIYAGDGEFIHASTRSRSVRFDRLDNKYFKKRYITARRVL